MSARVLRTVGTDTTPQCLGLYQGSVINTNDPLSQGRVQLLIPQVLGLANSNWAKPLGQISTASPIVVGQSVYVLFIGGDRNQPVYVPQKWSSASSSSFRMPWNVLGGWVGSNGDPGLAFSGVTGDAFPLSSFIYAMAVVVDTATTFSQVIMIGSAAQIGTGSFVSVTNSSGNWVAHATNVDAAFTGISASPQFVNLNLNVSITPSASQQIFYVMVLCPLAVMTPPTLFALPNSPNWAPGTQSNVAFPSSASSLSGSNSSIPNPQPISGLTIATNSPLWCAFK